MSDEDLIRRGDARDIMSEEGWLGDSLERINALPAMTVGVKPLVWREIARGLFQARTPFGAYHAWESAWQGPNDKYENQDDTPKEAAQADYAARILAALAPTDASQATAGQRLIAAASEAAAIARGEAEPAAVYVPDAAQSREAAQPDFVTLLTDAAAVAMKAREAALREAAAVADEHTFGGPAVRDAILALIGETCT